MGRGFFISFSYSDKRNEAANYKLKKIHSWGDWVHPFDPPAEVANGTTTDNIYCEFDAGHNSSGDAEYQVVDSNGNPIAYLAFKFKQKYNCCASNDYSTRVQFNCKGENYALFFGSQRYIPGTYPENWTDINGMPGDWEKVNITVAYMGNAPLSPTLYSWLTAHNAFANEEEGWIYYQQYESFKDQLAGGVRSFMLDTWIDNGKVVLAHGGTSGFPAMQKMGAFATLTSYLDILKTFLQNNPGETVFLILEDHVNNSDTLRDIFLQYKNYLFGEENSGNWDYSQLKNKTATLQGMDGKFLVFIDKRNNWIPYTYDYFIETVYGDQSLSENLAQACVQRGESHATDSTVGNYPFLLINQFPTWDRYILTKVVGGASILLIALSFIYPPLGLIGGLGLIGSAIAEAFHKDRIAAINNAELLIKKVDWVRKGPNVDQGQYAKIPNFIALDYVLSGNAINAIGYAIDLSIKNYMNDHAQLNPSTVLLAEYLVADQTQISAYAKNRNGTIRSLPIDTSGKKINLIEISEEYEVHIVYGSANTDIYIGDVKSMFFSDTIAWYFEYKRKYIDYEPFTTRIPSGTPLKAFIRGLFTRWHDVNTGQIEVSSNPTETDSKLNIVSDLGGIDVNFIDIIGVEGSNYYKIYVQPDNGDPILCATCYDKTVGLQMLASADNSTRTGQTRSSKKSEVPQGYFLEMMSKSVMGRGHMARFYKKLKDAGRNKLVALPAVTSLFSYENGQEFPIALASQVVVKKALDGSSVCNVNFDPVALELNFNLLQINTLYYIVATRTADSHDVQLAEFSLMQSGDETIFETFRYLEAGV